MTRNELYRKASDLPLLPGVYLMHDSRGVIIYIGKAVKLRNRVSQYFAPRVNRDYKTQRMVSNVDFFEVIITRTEMEALILECTLIKQHKPHYNILLKDDKAYPFICLNTALDYPNISLSNRREGPGEFYGPYGGRYLTSSIISTLQKTLKLPSCSKTFPQDIGKERPCLNYHLGICDGWCRPALTPSQYLERISQLKQILNGHYSSVCDDLKQQMEAAADRLDFETAAELRDRRNAVLSLKEKQIISSGRRLDTDAVGVFHTETRICFCILHYLNGVLLDKDFEIVECEYDQEAFDSFLKQYYLAKEDLPKHVLLPFRSNDADLLEKLLSERKGSAVSILVPERGNNVSLVELAVKNAEEEMERTRTSRDRGVSSLLLLEEMTGIRNLHRLEAYDVSNTSGTDIVAGMIVYENGSFRKQAYKRFKIHDLSDQDDYASMRQTLSRRFQSYAEGKDGFVILPDLLLIDGGSEHASVAESVLSEFDLSIPVLGMVKDGRHRTRALVSADGEEINVSSNQTVFSLIGSIQEEVHRFAVSYHRLLRTQKLKKSRLDSIPGIGSVRKQLLLQRFHSESGISKATVEELENLLPRSCAESVYNHFHGGERDECVSLPDQQEE